MQVPYDEESITGRIALQAGRPILQQRNLSAFAVNLRRVSLLETPRSLWMLGNGRVKLQK
jgi:hypothetical protein